jgi:hypothetical protein
MYLKVFECTSMYLNVFIVYLNVFECTYKIFMLYFNAFIVCFDVFHCISMCLSIDIVIGILPSHSHCNVFTMHTFFFHSTQWLHSQYAILLHYYFPFPLICSNFHTIYEKITYQSLLHVYTSSHIPHSMSSLVVRSIAEPKL